MINKTCIALIPKIDMVVSPKDFKPISLLNSVDKFITKTLASQLSPIINDLLDDGQSTFIKGWDISNYYIVAHDTMHYIHHNKKSGLIIK